MRKPRPIYVAAVTVLLCLLVLGFAAEPQTAPLGGAPAAPTQQPPASRPRPFVVLDAAHGGTESGAALSPSLLEKAVNFALARRVQKELEARGIPVELIRSADTLLMPEQRALAANTSHASLYIALHASTGGHGLRFYTALLPSSHTGEARRSFLLWETAQSAFLSRSQAAAAVLSAECASGGLPVRSSQASIRPLNSVTLPAVAVELSPLGGAPDDLADAEYQQKVAVALASGIARLRGQWEAAR